jgi:hypothetical protein
MNYVTRNCRLGKVNLEGNLNPILQFSLWKEVLLLMSSNTSFLGFYSRGSLLFSRLHNRFLNTWYSDTYTKIFYSASISLKAGDITICWVKVLGSDRTSL